MASWFEQTEPTVNSTIRLERIQARRNRINKRINQFPQKRSGDTSSTETSYSKIASISTDITTDFVRPNLVLSQKQIDSSMQILDKLIRDGLQLTTNVEKAVDARELEWREKEKLVRAERLAKLEAEEKTGKERFQEMEKAWELLFKHKVPHILYKKIMEQKQACDDLVEEKNNLIDHLKKELENKEEAFAQNIRKQSDDIKVIIERMNEHVSIMKKAYKEELEAMELAFLAERQEILVKHQTKWNEILESITDKENEFVSTRQKLIEECQDDLDKQWKDDLQEYWTVKDKMENDIMKLELEYRTLKAKVLMNQEKLEYNFHTLKKRDEENTVMKNKQKRRLTRMNDTMANLKRKLLESKKKCNIETQKLSDDYESAVNQLLELEKKYTHFQKVDINKYNQIWRMNEEEAKKIANRLLQLDRTIHEQYLSIPWIEPDLHFMSNVGPWGSVALNPFYFAPEESLDYDEAIASGSISNRNISKTALLLTEVAKKTKRDDTKSLQSDVSQTASLPSLTIRAHDVESTVSIFSRASKKKLSPTITQPTLKRIMLLLCDESGFLIEDRIQRIINNLSKSEQNLVKINSIFNALGIHSEEEMLTLSSYFIKYVSPDDEKSRTTLKLQPSGIKDAQSADSSKISKVPDSSKSIVFSDVKDPVKKISRKTTQTKSILHVSPEQINPSDVLRALREFVNDHRKVTNVVEIAPTLTCQKLVRNDKHDKIYWNFYLDVISPQHQRLWKALIPALEKFYKILVQRSKLQTEVLSLRVQNTELQSILDQYLRAKPRYRSAPLYRNNFNKNYLF